MVSKLLFSELFDPLKRQHAMVLKLFSSAGGKNRNDRRHVSLFWRVPFPKPSQIARRARAMV